MLKVTVPKTYVDQINNKLQLASSIAYCIRALYESFDDVYATDDEYTWEEIEDLYTALIDICAACTVATDNETVPGFSQKLRLNSLAVMMRLEVCSTALMLHTMDD